MKYIFQVWDFSVNTIQELASSGMLHTLSGISFLKYDGQSLLGINSCGS